jgi:hypothetical protein
VLSLGDECISRSFALLETYQFQSRQILLQDGSGYTVRLCENGEFGSKWLRFVIRDIEMQFLVTITGLTRLVMPLSRAA